MDSYLIVGLGNPGKLYEMTRHNIGFKILKKLAKKYNLKFKREKKLQAKAVWGNILKHEVCLLMPQTYVNESGASVKKTIDYFKLDIKNILVVVDDADINFEEFRLKKSGSSGGHNGLQSIEEHLNTKEYGRLKIGIGKESNLKVYVLKKFTKEEKKVLPEIENKAINFIEMWLEKGIEVAANKANVRLKKNWGKNEKRKKTPL